MEFNLFCDNQVNFMELSKNWLDTKFCKKIEIKSWYTDFIFNNVVISIDKLIDQCDFDYIDYICNYENIKVDIEISIDTISRNFENSIQVLAKILKDILLKTNSDILLVEENSKILLKRQNGVIYIDETSKIPTDILNLYYILCKYTTFVIKGLSNDILDLKSNFESTLSKFNLKSKVVDLYHSEKYYSTNIFGFWIFNNSLTIEYLFPLNDIQNSKLIKNILFDFIKNIKCKCELYILSDIYFPKTDSIKLIYDNKSLISIDWSNFNKILF